ncbi:Ankyrin repeats (3 copies) [compost metagenome]
MQYLIDVPGLISQRDRHGRTPLMYLSRHFDHKMINLLKLKGVDLNQDIGLGRNLLHLAATKKDHRIFEMLVSIGLNKDKMCNRGETPIDTLKRYSIKEIDIAKASNE